MRVLHTQRSKARLPTRTSPIRTRSYLRRLYTLNTMGEEQRMVHEIYTNTIEIPKFSGDSDDISLEDYIARIDTYIANRGIHTDELKIQAFKANINPEKGSARTIIRCRDFEEEIKDYKRYLEEFRKHFSQPGESEPLRVLVKYLNIQRKDDETVTDYICRLDNFSKQVETNLKATPWTENGQPQLVSLRNLSKILMMAKVVADCKGNMVEKLYKDLTNNTNLSQINYMIKEYLEKDPQSNQYVLPVRARSSSPPRGERQSRQRNQSTNRSHASWARRDSRPSSTIHCYTCNRYGHTTRDCQTYIVCGNCQYQGHREDRCRGRSWCLYHRMVGHRTRDCRRGSRANFRLGPPGGDGGRTPPPAQ